MDKKTTNTNLLMCLIYASISIVQTFNSRYLYKSLQFDFYAFVITNIMQIFAVQRIGIILLCYFATMRHKHINIKLFIIILPYSAVMCSSNILSSFCITVMPIAAFLAFKKFIILFILMISVILTLPTRINILQNACIVGIVLGGVLIGEKDILNGNFIGYASCLGFDLSDAISLQYAAYLFRKFHLQPQELLFYNAIVSLPYYFSTILYEKEVSSIIDFLQFKSSLLFITVFVLSIFLALASEFSSSYIAMKISPFEKSTVSNIKDLLLTLISVYYLREFVMTYISSTGLILCLVSSGIFANQELKHKTLQQIQQMKNKSLTLPELEEIQLFESVPQFIEPKQERITVDGVIQI